MGVKSEGQRCIAGHQLLRFKFSGLSMAFISYQMGDIFNLPF